ncbi:DUF7697 family protein [Profundibacter sp.]
MVVSLNGQLRVSPVGKVIGWDMASALALAGAMGANPAAIGHLLPPVEAVMVRAMNESNEE